MQDDKKDDLSKLLVDQVTTSTSLCSTIATASPTITVTTTSIDPRFEDKELIFPEAIPSEAIAEDVLDEVGDDFEPYKRRFVESVETVKTYASEFKIELGPIKFTIKRQPKKTIKYYGEK